MGKINFFIARTPLQLFNCIEAKNRFHQDEKNILFYQYQRDIDKIQIENLIETNRWFKVIAYPLTPSRRLFFPIFLYTTINTYQQHVVCCYYGAYNSIVSYLINKVHPANNFLVDDGVKTIKIAELIKDKKLDKKGFLRPLRDKILGSSRDYIYKSKFFTIYDEIKIFLPNRVIKNDYSAFKKRISSMKKENIIYFIGTNLLEKIIKTKKTFEVELEKVIHYYHNRNQKMIYILHRYEDIEYMQELSKAYNFECIKFDNIIETELLNRGTIPNEVASFASTAVETINIIYDIETKIFELDNSGLFNGYQKVFQKLYNNFRGKNIEVIKL